MRILVYTNLYPPHAHGGNELVCKDMVERFREAGHEVTVLTSTAVVPGVTEGGDPTVRREIELYWDDHVLLSPPVCKRWRIEKANRAALQRALDDVRPDVLSLWNMGATSLGLLNTVVESGIPVVYAVCDEWPVYAPFLDAWTRLFERAARLRGAGRALGRVFGVPVTIPDVGRSGAFLFVSELMRRKAEEGSRWTFPEWALVRSGIDERDFPVVPMPSAARPWTGKLLYVGRLDPRKGIETAIRALPLLPDSTTLDVVGSGDHDEAARLRAIVASLGLHDRVTFSVSARSDLAARYAAADVLVFPSTWEEPWGLVPIEAMACGTPVVATGTGGSAEFLVDGRNCVLYPAGDHAALAAAVARLASSEPLRLELVAGGRETASRITAARMAEEMLAWHIAAAEGFRHGRPPRETPL